jgi:phosphocarrier protein
MKSSIIVEIVNKRGLHARAAAKFVKTVTSTTSTTSTVQVIKLGHEGEEPSAAVGGSSILGLMMLGADPGSRLSISAEGDQADEVLASLKELIENKFGEGE